ncbi:MAG: HD domain-containing protein [Candidatus Magasanikbacteria bacterium]|jgi:(p)ppGpp synthase/HD superfamily hydrolase
MKSRFRNIKYHEKLFHRYVKKQSARGRDILTRAFLMAQTAHINQRRYEGDQYFIHPLRVANSLIYEFKSKNCAMIAAALLHDVVEDTDIKLPTIEKEFDREIARLVKNLTRPRHDNECELSKKISKGRRYNFIMRADKKTRIVKCADMLDNMRCWCDLFLLFPKYNKITHWFGEANRYYLPLAQKTNRAIEIQMHLALDRAIHTLRP